MIFGFFLSFSIFSISLLPVMSYMTLSSQEKTLFQKIISLWPFFYSGRACGRIRQTTSQNIVGTDAWAVPPTSNLGDRPPSPRRSPPVAIQILKFNTIQHNHACLQCSANFIHGFAHTIWSQNKPLLHIQLYHVLHKDSSGVSDVFGSKSKLRNPFSLSEHSIVLFIMQSHCDLIQV